MKKSEITLKRTQTAVGTMANQLVTTQKTMGQEHNAVPAFAAISVSHPDAAVTAVTTAVFSLAYPGKEKSTLVHLKTCLLPRAALDAGSY